MTQDRMCLSPWSIVDRGRPGPTAPTSWSLRDHCGECPQCPPKIVGPFIAEDEAEETSPDPFSPALKIRLISDFWELLVTIVTSATLVVTKFAITSSNNKNLIRIVITHASLIAFTKKSFQPSRLRSQVSSVGSKMRRELVGEICTKLVSVRSGQGLSSDTPVIFSPGRPIVCGSFHSLF